MRKSILYRMSESDVSKFIKHIEEKGYYTRQGDVGHAKRYQLHDSTGIMRGVIMAPPSFPTLETDPNSPLVALADEFDELQSQ